MSSKLPEKVAGSIPSLSERAALFADPSSLLGMDPGTLRELAAEVAVEAGPIMKQVRAMVGLVSWALRSKVPAGEFGAWIQSYSELVGVSVRTLHEWRVQATEQVGIIDPYKSKREPKAAGESGRLAESRQSPKVIPAASTEAPAKKSEGEGNDGLAASTSGSPASATGHPFPADQSSGGARATAPSPRRDAPTGVSPASRPAPPDPTEITASHTDTDWSKVAPTTTERPPTDRALTARVFSAMRDIDPTDAALVGTADEATFGPQWMERFLAAWKAKNVPTTIPGATLAPKRRPGYVRKAKAPDPEANGSGVAVITCTHPKAKERNTGYAILCGECGKKLR